MAAEISAITESYDVWPDQIFGYLQAMNAKLDQVIADQARQEAFVARLGAAWSAGGLRGLRQALEQVGNGR